MPVFWRPDHHGRVLILFTAIQDNLTWDVSLWRYALLLPIDLVILYVIVDD